VQALYIFGDSLVDVGNNNYLPMSILRGDYPFNGIDFPGKKPTGRFSNGKNAADFVAEKLNVPPPPPYLSRRNDAFQRGVSFASGGAGIMNTTNAVVGQNIPLVKQFWYFNGVRQRKATALGSESAARDHFANSIFLFVVGSNDLLNFDGGKNSSSDPYISLMVSNLKNILKDIHGLGARKFLIVGTPPVGCTPRQRSHFAGAECNGQLNSMCEKFNGELGQALAQLSTELADFRYSYFDTYRVLLEMIQSAAAYGFLETKSACCGLGKLRAEIPCTPVSLLCANRTDHVFWDIYHPTEAAARAAVDELFNGSTPYATPISVQELI
ncbi:hypothetical protein M569_07514, partial [Genlisea aurea]